MKGITAFHQVDGDSFPGPLLRRLVLSYNPLGDRGLAGLAGGCPKGQWVALMELGLEGCRLGCLCAKPLSLILQDWVSLRQLTLSWNDLGLRGNSVKPFLKYSIAAAAAAGTAMAVPTGNRCIDAPAAAADTVTAVHTGNNLHRHRRRRLLTMKQDSAVPKQCLSQT